MSRILKSCAILIISLAVMAIHAGPAHAANGKEERLRKAMIKIFSISASPNYYAPWRSHDPSPTSGSGCVIKGNLIITNAHVVSNSKFIQVQPYGDPERYNARVRYIAHEVDLAILEVEDKGMFKGISPLSFGSLPDTLDEVLVYGFPTGGTSLSITKGVLSRIEYQRYAHSNGMFLAGQLDAAINPGNSGGPAIKDGKIVGITMQKNVQRGIDNIGYMIPTPVIDHFLKDIEDGKYDGFPLVGFSYQDMESPSMKDKYMMGRERTGVLITHVSYNSPAKDTLKKDDVLLSVDGHRVADDGTVETREDERLDFLYYIHAHQLGEEVSLRVLREGREHDLKVRLSVISNDTKLVDTFAYDSAPSFFIFGGFVITPITENYICTWKGCNAPGHVSIYLRKRPTEQQRDKVVIIRVLADESNKGFHHLTNFVVDTVNGQEYVDFADFYNKVMALPGRFVTITDDNSRQVVIDRQLASESHERIMQQYGVSSDHSPDLE